MCVCVFVIERERKGEIMSVWFYLFAFMCSCLLIARVWTSLYECVMYQLSVKW